MPSDYALHAQLKLQVLGSSGEGVTARSFPPEPRRTLAIMCNQWNGLLVTGWCSPGNRVKFIVSGYLERKFEKKTNKKVLHLSIACNSSLQLVHWAVQIPSLPSELNLQTKSFFQSNYSPIISWKCLQRSSLSAIWMRQPLWCYFQISFLQLLNVCYLMCKVCRLWGVLSLALFTYACRPNFHHKHLALSDPLLSVSEEALISLHTCADRPKILKSGPCMNACFRLQEVWAGAGAHAYVCMHECVEQFRTILHALIILRVPFLLFFPLARPQSSAGRHSSLQKERNHLCWRVSQSERRLGFVSPPSASSVHESWVRWGK